MDGIEIRRMRTDDRARVRTLFEAVYRDTFACGAPVFEDATEGEKIYAAFLGGKLAGLASVWEPDRFIHYLFVDLSARHKGVGAALVSRLAEIYGPPLTLKCLVKNEGAMAFYRATGWQEVETVPDEEGAYTLFRYGPAARADTGAEEH